MGSKICTLEEICEDYKIVLLDNSVILQSFDSCLRHHYTQDKIRLLRDQFKSISFWKPYFIKYSNIYLIPEVLKELDCRAVENKKIKYKKRKGKEQERYGLPFKEFTINLNIYLKRKKDLLKLIKKTDSTIQLTDSEKEKIKHLFNTCEYLKNQEKQLSDVDYSIIINGICLSQTRGKTVILSNDGGIFYAWRDSVKKYLFLIKPPVKI